MKKSRKAPCLDPNVNFISLVKSPQNIFFALEKRRAKAKAITSVILEDGREITGQKEILKEMQCFFQKLYKTKNHQVGDLNELMKNVEAPKISEEMKKAMDLPLEMNEFSQALKQMPNNKCPGRSGLNTEFYKTFWNRIKKTLL